MEKYSADQLRDFKEIFDSFDSSNDGNIDVNELHSLARQMGVECSISDIQHFLEANDKDQNGSMDFSEFVSMMSKFGL